jgi:hypothetical protein
MFPYVHSNSVLSANSSTLFNSFVQNLGIIEGRQIGDSSAEIGPQNIFLGDFRKLVRSLERISGRDGAEILGSGRPSLGTGVALFSEHSIGNCRRRELMFTCQILTHPNCVFSRIQPEACRAPRAL